MKLEAVSSFCGELIVCPTVYKSDRGTAVVQGYRVNRDEVEGGVEIPDGEDVVEIPLDLIFEAAEKLGV